MPNISLSSFSTACRSLSSFSGAADSATSGGVARCIATGAGAGAGAACLLACLLLSEDQKGVYYLLVPSERRRRRWLTHSQLNACTRTGRSKEVKGEMTASEPFPVLRLGQSRRLFPLPLIYYAKQGHYFESKLIIY